MDFGANLATHLALSLNKDIEDVLKALDSYPIKSPKVRYNYSFLVAFCKNNGITLLKDYSAEKINTNTSIIAKCINCDANMEEKSFRCLVNHKNFGCGRCSKIIKTTKLKATNLERYGAENLFQHEEFKQKTKLTNLERYGVEFSSQNKDIKQKIKNTSVAKYGVSYPMQNKDIKQKSKDGMLEKYGVENPMRNTKSKQKAKATNLAKYGVEYASQNEKIKQKAKDTMLEKYGVEHTLQNAKLQQKAKDTMLEKYGVEYSMQIAESKQKAKNTTFERHGFERPFQNEEIRLKCKATMLERYNVEYPTQNEEFKQKSKATNLERYGYEYAMQNAEIADKSSKNAYKLKEYTFPSGNTIKVQGYENYALDALTNAGVSEDDIVTDRSKVPEVWYTHDGKYKRYYVDIFIPSQNRCIEVKSTWTAQKKRDIIFIKQKAVVYAGYTCEIWIYDGKGKRVK